MVDKKQDAFAGVVVAVALAISTVSCAGYATSEPAAGDTEGIIGGTSASSGAWPWQVNVRTPEFPLEDCGGALLSTNWMLTAGHCVTDSSGNVRPATDFNVTLGDRDITVSDGTEQTSAISQVVRNPAWFADSQGVPDNDTALMRLTTPVVFTSAVKPIRPAVIADSDGLAVTATGWGWIDSAGDEPNVLQQVNMTTQPSATCASTLGHGLPADQFCAGVANGSVATCHGDSGGALVTKRPSGTWEEIGIVSWGQPDCTSYSVFARVSSQIAWVRKYVLDVATVPVSDLIAVL